MNAACLAGAFSPVIDAHAHVGGMWPDEWVVVPVEECIRMMDRCGIHKVCTSASRYLRFDFREGNLLTLEAARRYPDRIIAFAVADPLRRAEAAASLDRTLGDEGFAGIKLHISHTRLPYNHRSYDFIYEKAQQYGVPVLAHTFSEEDVAAFLDAARRFPEVPFIVGHSGGYRWLNVLDAITAVQNAYFDLCCSCVDAGRLEAFVAAAGAHRVLFGTDLPLLHPATVLSQVIHAPLTDADKALILGGNMVRILGGKG